MCDRPIINVSLQGKFAARPHHTNAGSMEVNALSFTAFKQKLDKCLAGFKHVKAVEYINPHSDATLNPCSHTAPRETHKHKDFITRTSG